MNTNLFGPIYQLGYAVKSVDPWMQNFIDAGVGPFWVFRNLGADVFKYHNEVTAAKFDCAVSWTGSVMIEIIAPLDDHPSPFLDHLRSGREGLQHTAWRPRDVAAVQKELASKGYNQTVSGNTGGFFFDYFARPGLDSIEICRLTDDVYKSHRELEGICASWDGSQPIRDSYTLAK